MSNFPDISIDEDIIRFSELINQGKKILLVEGESDKLYLEELMKCNSSLEIFECDGKENVVGIISDKELVNDSNIRGLIDRDFDSLLEIDYTENGIISNLIYTDFSSLEYYMINSDEFLRWFKNFIGQNNYDKIKDKRLECIACKMLKDITMVRYFNKKNNYDINLKLFFGTHKYVKGKCYLDKGKRYKHIKKLLKRTGDLYESDYISLRNRIYSKLDECTSIVSKDELIDFIESHKERQIHPQGHDLVSALVLIVNGFVQDHMKVNDEVLKSMLVDKATIQLFKKFPATNEIHTWVCN